jgi:hypothetical protein
MGFVPIKDTTDAVMTDTILHQLPLLAGNTHGPGCDNGSNMKEERKCTKENTGYYS